MMTRLIAFLLLVSAPLMAAEVSITVPNTAIPRALELCDEIRTEFRIREAEFSNEVCAEIMFREGLRQFEIKKARREILEQTNGLREQRVGAWEQSFPEPFTRAFCGDGIVDLEFGEECDPPLVGTCDAQCDDILTP